MSVETKIGIYLAAVLPVLLYGAEVLVLSVKESTRLEVFHRKCLRVILGRIGTIGGTGGCWRRQECAMLVSW